MKWLLRFKVSRSFHLTFLEPKEFEPNSFGECQVSYKYELWLKDDSDTANAFLYSGLLGTHPVDRLFPELGIVLPTREILTPMWAGI